MHPVLLLLIESLLLGVSLENIPTSLQGHDRDEPVIVGATFCYESSDHNKVNKLASIRTVSVFSEYMLFCDGEGATRFQF